jgi:surface protein
MAVGCFKLPISGASNAGNAWTRPADWLTIPTLGAQEVIGLMAVYDDEANYVAMQCTGAYTVDWGDGTITNYASSAVASRQYVFSTISPSTTTTKGFRQVLVRVTPQGVGNLTLVNFGITNPTIGKSFAPGWLEFDVRTPNALPTYAASSNIIRYARLEKITIRQMSTASLSNLFSSLYSLKSVYIEPSETNGSTASNNMFLNCYSLEDVNLFDTSTITNASTMFQNCYNLQTVPQFNFSATTNVANIFNNCYSLTTVPELVMGTDCTQMFVGCNSLVTVGLMTTTLVNSFSNMFQNCVSLTSVPLINTVAGNNFTSMFAGCNSLQEVPLLNTSNATNMTGMFNGAQSIIYLPTLNTANVTTLNQTFNNCVNLRQLPAFNLPLCTVFTSWLGANTTLSKSLIINPTRGHSYSGMSLSQANIVTIFNNLGTASGAQTITVSNNPGYAGLTVGERAIATGKGWTIA